MSISRHSPWTHPTTQPLLGAPPQPSALLRPAPAGAGPSGTTGGEIIGFFWKKYIQQKHIHYAGKMKNVCVSIRCKIQWWYFLYLEEYMFVHIQHACAIFEKKYIYLICMWNLCTVHVRCMYEEICMMYACNVSVYRLNGVCNLQQF